MGRASSRPSCWGSLSLLAVGFLSLAGCTAASREYGEIMKGRQPCDCQERKPWCEYGEILRGQTPCPPAGRARCDDDCGCAPARRPCDCAPKAPCAGPISATMPPEAKPGEAWCRVEVPARYETVTERVQTQCARTTQIWVPPVFQTQVRRVLAEPATSFDLELPGVTKSVERCQTCAAGRTETRAVTTTDACGRCTTRCETVPLPPTTCTTLEEVCIQGPTSQPVRIPAVYTAEVCEVEVTPGHWETVEIPALTETVTKSVCVSPARAEWRRNPACEVPVPAAPTPCAPAAPRK